MFCFIACDIKLMLCSCVVVGLEASITDSDENSAILTNAQIVLESEDENKIQVSKHQKLLIPT